MNDPKNTAALSLISLYEISKLLNGSLNLEKTLREVLNLLSSYLHMRRGLISLVGDGGRLEIVAAAGMSNEAARQGKVRPVQNLSARILSSGMPIVIPNLKDEPELAGSDAHDDSLDDEKVAFIGVPIKTTDKAFGVLSIERVWDGAGDVNFESDVRFLAMAANLLGHAVHLRQAVAKDREALLEDKHRLQKELTGSRISASKGALPEMVGTSAAMREVFGEVLQIAASATTVLLRGESGTGKELIARAIHANSPRKNGPFIKVNCAALSETLLESELFGHEKGAFTGATQERKGRFELADKGTLFLDEIGEISQAFQSKLLRVLQEREFERVGGNKTLKTDVRLICATNRNLEEAVTQGEFRADLYFRINVVPVFVPPLRERKDDIPLLAKHFLDRFNAENKRQLKLSDEALETLRACYFPGNVRELENCVQRVATTTKGDVIKGDDLPCQKNLCLSSALWKQSAPLRSLAEAEELGSELDEEEFAATGTDGAGASLTGDGLPPKNRLVQAMEKTGWVQAKAARLLGLTPRQVGYALKKYNISIKRI
ncbi:MAG: nif-specific transcriptional activator NifA [Rhodospirillales bacterium]|nr:MAG: nif-specific transcriptional activator NifA [Rhodospirillales bacterium]